MPVSITDAFNVFSKVAAQVDSVKIQNRVEAPSLQVDEREEVHEQTSVVYTLMPSTVKCSIDELREKLVHVVKPSPPENPVYALDGSTRLLDSSKTQIGIYTIAASYYDGGFIVGVYPHDGVNPYLGIDGAPFATIGPRELDPNMPSVYSRPLVEPEGFRRLLDCEGVHRRACGLFTRMGYGAGFDAKTMLDENRLLAETHALEHIVLVDGPKRVILIDGPLYSTPSLYAALQRSSLMTLNEVFRAYYALSYLANTAYRLKVLVEAVKRSIEVIGVVKRLGMSKYLIHALSACSRATELPLARDLELVDLLAEKQRGPIAIGPMVTGLAASTLIDKIGGHPLHGKGLSRYIELFTRSKLGFKTLDDLSRMLSTYIVMKKVYYIVIPGWGRRIVLRVELPCILGACRLVAIASHGQVEVVADPRDAYDEDSQLLSTLVWLTLYPDTISIPAPIVLADRAAGRLAKSLMVMGYHLLREKVSFTYETLISLQEG